MDKLAITKSKVNLSMYHYITLCKLLQYIYEKLGQSITTHKITFFNLKFEIEKI